MINEQNKKPIKTGTQKRLIVTIELALLLGTLPLIVYANTLKNGFVYDDSSAIVNNTIVTKGAWAIPEILVTPYHKGSDINSNDLYRPMSLATFAVEYSLFEKNPMPYHLVNILVFAGCVILLFLFFDKLFEQKKTNAAFIASILFALHPIHTEVVANIKSCDELLCFFFAFLSLNIFIKYLDSGKIILLLTGSFCFFLSLLSKETAISFLAVIPLIFFFYRNENKKRSSIITIGIVFSALIYLFIRFMVLNKFNTTSLSAVPFLDNALANHDIPLGSRIATAVLILGKYILLLLAPYPLQCDYSYNSIPFVHIYHPLVLLSLLAYLFVAFYSIKRLIKKQKDAFAFAGLFFLITISIFTNIPFLIGTIMGERLLFFSSAGFCLAFALLIEKWTVTTGSHVFSMFTQPKLLVILGVVSIVYFVLTIDRNSDWVDNYTLFKTDLQKAPENAKLNYSMGHELENKFAAEETDPVKQKEIRMEEISYFNKAIDIYPEFANANADLGYVYFHIYKFDSAMVYDLVALRLKPNFPDVSNNLGQVYFAERKFQQAIDVCKNGLITSPQDARLYSNIAACFGSMNQLDSAIYYAKIGVSVNPGINAFYENISFAYKLMGNMDSALKYEAIAQRNNPNFRVK